MPSDKKEKTWFERNPKKTLFVSSLAFFLIFVFSVEKILSLKSENSSKPRYARYIRLREIRPLLELKKMPPDRYLKQRDSLVKKYYRLATDENGFIVPSKIHNDPDLKIVFLGGSTTECALVDEENRFPYLVGRLLEKETGLKVNSYNSGVSGNNTLHSVDVLLNKVMSMNPHTIVMMHNLNDLSILLLEKSYWNKNLMRSPLVEKNYKLILRDFLVLVKDSFIPNIHEELRSLNMNPGDLLRLRRIETDEFKHVRGKKIEIDTPRLLKAFRKNLQLFINTCSAMGVTPILMTQPNRLKENPDEIIANWMNTIKRDYTIPYDKFREIYNLFNQTIRETGANNNVLVIDLAKEIPQEKEYLYDIVHFNDNGSKLVAKIITQHLASFLKTRPHNQ